MTKCTTVCSLLMMMVVASTQGASAESVIQQPGLEFSLLHVPNSVEEEPESGDADNDGGEDEPETPIIGIDFGFTKSSVGVFHNGTIRTVTDERGSKVISSAVAFMESGKALAGYPAETYRLDHPERSVYEIKKLIGREWDDPSVQRNIQRFTYKVVEKDNEPHIEMNIGGRVKKYSPVDLAAITISKLKTMAEDLVGESVTEAVIAVPAYFNDRQRRATRDACNLAGLDVVRIINEPNAAVLGYDLNADDPVERAMLVYNFGVGSLDVALVTVDSGVFETLETNMDNLPAGANDLVQHIADFLLNEFHRKNGRLHPSEVDREAFQRLSREVERMLTALSAHDGSDDDDDDDDLVINIDIESFHDGENLSVHLTRAEFDKLITDILRPVTDRLCDTARQEVGYRVDNGRVDYVLLVGGSRYAPFIMQTVQDYFGDDKAPMLRAGRNDAVVLGMTKQAMLMKDSEEMLLCGPLLEVNPLSIGIETVGGVMLTILPMRAKLPAEKVQTFTTAVDDQSTVTVQIYRGEEPFVKDNNFLGHFNLTGIPPGPRETPRIQVAIRAEYDGSLVVEATESLTGVTASLSFSAWGHLWNYREP